MTKKYWIASKWVGFSHVNCGTAIAHTHVNILWYECASLAVKVNHRLTPKGITQLRLFAAAYRSSCSLRNCQQRRGCVREEILYVWWYTAVIVATDCVSLQCQECSMSDRIFFRYGFLHSSLNLWQMSWLTHRYKMISTTYWSVPLHRFVLICSRPSTINSKWSGLLHLFITLKLWCSQFLT